jgi:nitrite reductase/ring-hydroxylating ferredoxin subunit
MAAAKTEAFVYAASADEVRQKGVLVVRLEGHSIALFADSDRIFAVDNRCPHLGFPLDRGTVKDCVLTCHWHQARFDLSSGGTFDPWADDVRAFPIELRGSEVWIDLTPQTDPREHQRGRLRDGLERNLSLVLSKAAILLLDRGEHPADPFRIGLEFGVQERQAGWGQGLTMHTCLMNMLPLLDAEDRPRALSHGLSAVAQDCAGMPPRFPLRPLPNSGAGMDTLKMWFRQFIAVRDSDGAERCVASAIRAGADHRMMAEMLFAGATDHRYIQVGHPLDFVNKALEALDIAGWNYAESVLTSLVGNIAGASRMEESNSWRNPIDLVAILEAGFEQLPASIAAGNSRRETYKGNDSLISILLADDPYAAVDALLDALRNGALPTELASAVSSAAVLRIVRFHTSNEFGDWDRALHTLTFANAVEQGLRRAPSPELLRGVFDAAMSIYLDRFLNVPSARLIKPPNGIPDADRLEDEFLRLLNLQQQVNEAGGLVSDYLGAGHDGKRLLAVLGKALLREDRNFHTIQMVEAAFQQYRQNCGTPAATNALVAAARYLAAHAPTMRAQGQTYAIAQRLYRGEKLFEE